MGYNTRFTGYVSGPSELMDEFNKDASNRRLFGRSRMNLSDWLDGDMGGGDEIKWYGWKDDMLSVSKEYPALLFCLEGEGEESGDIWKAWARNGRVVVVEAEIVFRTPDLDTEIPSPDVEKMINEARAAKKAEIDAKIANLEKEREALDG